MISDRYRCVFVHIPRTAGTSIERALGWIPDGAIGPYQTVPHGTQDHRQIGELRRAMRPADFDAYFKFTLVRNPWDRVASWYKNVRNDPVHLRNFRIREDCTFRDFLIRHGDTWGLQPQLYWIKERGGEIPLDFIGRFEKLREDFETVLQRLGNPPIELPHLTESQDRTRYTRLYDDELRKVVAKRYAEEIDLFGYRFGE